MIVTLYECPMGHNAGIVYGEHPARCKECEGELIPVDYMPVPTPKEIEAWSVVLNAARFLAHLEITGQVVGFDSNRHLENGKKIVAALRLLRENGAIDDKST